MKICIISPVVIPILGNKEHKYGGIEIVIHNACTEMVKRGHEVYLLASGDSKTSAKLIPTTPKALGQGKSFDEEKKCNKKAYQIAIDLKPDVIWDHTLAIHAQKFKENLSKYIYKVDILLEPNKILDTKNIPVVHTLHGPAKDHIPKLIHDLGIAGHYFVSISKDQARRFLEFIPKYHHLGTVYNAVDIDFYKPINNKKADYLLWVGRYCMEKGPHIALEVAHRLKLPLYLIGKMAEKHERDYFDKFVKPNLSPLDKVVGEVSADIRAKYYGNAKATLMTNIWPEPFGLVAAESMASGTPVVGPAYGSLTELIDNAGVLINIDDIYLEEDDIEVTDYQKKYINRIESLMPKIEKIPPLLPRKRAEYLFSPKHNVDGYEEAFTKAIYLIKHS
jgi:glycosyltransferase involved in cell wall biosynthesis